MDKTVNIAGPTGSGTYNVFVDDKFGLNVMSLTPEALIKLHATLAPLVEALAVGDRPKR